MKNIKLIKSEIKKVLSVGSIMLGICFFYGCGDDTLGSDPQYSYGGAEEDALSDLGSEDANSQDHQGVKINKVPNNKGGMIDFDDSLFRDDNELGDNQNKKDDNNNLDSDSDNQKIGDNNNNEDSEEENFDNSKIVSFNGYKCYNVGKDICEIEYTIFKKTNEYRVARGLSQLKPNMALSATARSWSTSQSRMGYISHTGFPNSRNTILRGFDSDSSLDSKDISYLSGENVAATGYSFSSYAAVGESFYTMWINSAGHRQNIVGSHTYLGVGVVKTNSGMYKFYATQIFGR